MTCAHGAESAALRAVIRAAVTDPAHRAGVLEDTEQVCPYGEIVPHFQAIQRLLLDGRLRHGDCVTAELSNSVCSAMTILALLDSGYSVVVAPLATARSRATAGLLKRRTKDRSQRLAQALPAACNASYCSCVMVPPDSVTLPASRAGRASCTRSMRFQAASGGSHPGCGTLRDAETRWYLWM